LEEAHEVIAAIDAEDPSALADELGDLLLQVLLHSQIASEAGTFSLDGVIDLLSCKLIRRHPHVFADAPKDLDSINRTWEAVKEKEGGTKQSLPAILTARKFVSRLDDATVIEEGSYPTDEVAAGGRILAAIASAWTNEIDPEIALLKAIAYLSRVTESEAS
jgi:uncharacterized protein YabN with tetrapyrrole methylase and pyrophosphatase domain